MSLIIMEYLNPHQAVSTLLFIHTHKRQNTSQKTLHLSMMMPYSLLLIGEMRIITAYVGSYVRISLALWVS